MNRVVCLLLVPAVLLTQRAGLVHCHGQAQPAGHDLRSHFHTNRAAPGHDDDGHHNGHHHHAHHHPGPGSHHHHHDEDEAPSSDLALGPLADHDADAIFIPAIDAVPGGTPAAEPERVPLGVAAASALTAAQAPPGDPAIRPHPPPLIPG